MESSTQTMDKLTVGPVPDLEKHLPTEWGTSLFTSLFYKTEEANFEKRESTSQDLEVLFAHLNLKEELGILDLCCGSGRHALALAERGFTNITAIDRSRYLIRLARRKARSATLNVKFSEGDARSLRLGEQSQQLVTIFGNSFGLFERHDDITDLLNAIKRVLISEGHFVLDLVDGAYVRSHFDERSWEWIDKNHFICRERALSDNGTRIVTREVLVDSEKGVIADQFYQERLYDQDQIAALFKKEGFAHVAVDAAALPSNRLFITAQAPFKNPRKARTAQTITVTVILGDPSLPDSVKRNGQYNQEDLYTIEQLKRALTSLEGYAFTFLNNHKRLLPELIKKPPALVFNLCDEGFFNQATMELHVPSILETLQIPYTGAGPDALSLCYNKSIVRALATTLDISVPEETYFGSLDQAATLPSVFPALLKPNFGDNSIGITQQAVVNTASEFMDYINAIKRQFHDMPILVQEFLEGAEYSVGLIGNADHFTVLPILEVCYDNLPEHLPKILSYESKWDPKSPYWNTISYREAVLSEEDTRTLIEYSTRLFERTRCRDYARIDFRRDRFGQIKLLEVNPNPGWCWDGKFNLMASFQNISYPKLLELILKAAQDRL